MKNYSAGHNKNVEDILQEVTIDHDNMTMTELSVPPVDSFILMLVDSGLAVTDAITSLI